MAKYLTLDLLKLFKNKQDAANENKYMQTTEYVENGKVKSDVLNTQSNVIPIHVVTNNGTTKYYTDNNDAASSTEVSGSVGKIYIDIASGSKCIYTYDANQGFIPFASSIATEADIESLFDSGGIMAKKFESEFNSDVALENISNNESELLLRDFKLGLIKLGLKGIADINNKRVQNPVEFYNSLTALYKAVS